MKKRTAVIAALASLLVIGSVFTAHAEDTAISHVPLSISWDTAPKAGDYIGKVYASTSSSQFAVEGAVYVTDEDTWTLGEAPVVEIDLSASSGYYFKNPVKSYFSLSGCGAQYVTANIDGDASGLTLRVTLSSISGGLPATSSLSWDNYSAVWDNVSGARAYEVRLYKDNTLLTTVTAQTNSYDFSRYMNHEGTYTFDVKSKRYSNGQDSGWSPRSEGSVLSREDAWYCDDGSWQQNSNRIRFRYRDSSYPTNCWRNINDAWYYFDSQGSMVTDSYIKSATLELYYWVGANGAWEPQWDTATPDGDQYSIIR